MLKLTNDLDTPWAHFGKTPFKYGSRKIAETVGGVSAEGGI